MKPIHIPEIFRTMAAVVCLALLAGCNDKKPSENSSTPSRSASASATGSFILEQVLALWQQGDQVGAIQKFLDTDWKTASLFPPDSPMSLREADLPAMTVETREKRMADVMAQIQNLKALASAVRDQGATTTDKELARRYFTQLDECGAALDQPEALKILQLTARAIRKMSAAETAKLK